MILPQAQPCPIGSKLKNTEAAFLQIHDLLFRRYDEQHWWPGDSPFEVMVGAILTQSTSWQNVEKAIVNLKTAGVMSPNALRQIPVPELAQLIHPAGYYNAKAVKLKALVRWLSASCGDNLNVFFTRDTGELRLQLLDVHGIGPETADSILLYAGNKPVFVIDAYTRRIFSRLGLKPENDTYDAWQILFTLNLPQNTQLFNEYHALLVRLGKESCRKQPVCGNCCLRDICRFQFS
jgi:endonuclease III related protein